MGEFCMPSLGADMENGTLVAWLVLPGTMVKRGDIVALIETQKGLFEVEVFEEGVMGEPLVAAGQTVPVGTPLALIRAAGAPESAPAAAASPAGAGTTLAAAAKPAVQSVNEAAPTPPGQRISASPSARRLATELGIDLATVSGSGPHGVIQRGDVERAAGQQPAPEPAAAMAPAAHPSSPPAMSAEMRAAIAAAMSRANREIPHYYLEIDIDLSRPLHWLEAANRERSLRERILPAALLLKAVAKALREVPELNGYWQDDRLRLEPAIHIGFAVALRQGGLLMPAIRDADTLGLGEMMEAMGDLIERARAGRLRGSELTSATVSVTNLGDRGVKTVYGVIYPPQVALIGFGRITERPWAENGMLGARRCITATLAADHRATDGHQGALFLDALERHLHHPEDL